MKQQSVAIGIIENEQSQILISQRSKNTHLGGFWEFPGGKVDPGESFKSALRRELFEEVGIRILSVEKLIAFNFKYEDRNILFQCFKVLSYHGEVQAKEKQALKWLKKEELHDEDFPSANKTILDTIRLSQEYMIADQNFFGDDLLSVIEKNLQKDISICQFRAHTLNKKDYIPRAQEVRDLCAEYNAQMICNCNLDWIDKISPHGVHLTSKQLAEEFDSILDGAIDKLFSISCHTEQEIDLANQTSARCILIGSVLETPSHPNAESLGWKGFYDLCVKANKPVYALGGMNNSQKEAVLVYGAQGIAAIRAFSY